MIKNYLWNDNPTEANVAVYDPDILNECLMHLKYTNQKLTKFCVNSASVDAAGSPNLLTYSGNTVNFNSGNSLVPVMTSNVATGWVLSASHAINTGVNDVFKSFDADALSYCALSHCPTVDSPTFISVEKTAAFTFDYLYLKFSSIFNPGDMKNFAIQDALGNILYSYESTGAFLDKDEFLIPIDNFNSTKFVISTTANVNNVSYVNFPSTIKLLDKSQIISLTSAQGTSGLLSSVAGVSLGTTAGTYNLYLGLDGSVDAFATTFSVGKVLPTTPVANQIHYLTCSELPQAQKYNGSAWSAYDKVPVGKAVVAGGVITSITTNSYAQNGYDMNLNTLTDYVVEAWSSADGQSWYRKYKSGWVEQSFVYGVTNRFYGQVSLLTPMRTSSYSVLFAISYTTSDTYKAIFLAQPSTTTAMYLNNSGHDAYHTARFYICG